jgi:DNA-binding transcriptional MerR regulator
MNYSINQVAKTLGISQSTIRRYEDRGLINPRRIEGSGYRIYTVADIIKISIFLSMRLQSFSTDEIASRSYNFKDESNSIKSKLYFIDEEIGRLNATRKCWEDQLNLLMLAEELNSKDWKIIEYPEIMVSYITQCDELQDNNSFFKFLRQRDTNAMFFRLCNIFKKENMEQGIYSNYQAFFNKTSIFSEKNNCHIIPAGKYLISNYNDAAFFEYENSHNSKEQIEKIYLRVHELTEKSNQKLKGDVMAIAVQINKTCNKSVLFIPV